jgi:lipoprotein NlpI
MKKSFRLLAYLVVVVLLLPHNVSAQGLEELRAGNRAMTSGDLDAAIERYTAAIRAGDLAPQILAIVYNNRGAAHGGKKEYDKALADYNEALKQNPNFGDAYNNRGNTYLDKRDYERAVKDYDAAVRLTPLDDLPYANRGRARFYQGQYKAAEEDLTKAAANTAYPYNALWLYLARERAGADGKTELEKSALNLKHEGATEKVVAVFLGRAAPGDVIEAVRSDPRRQKQDICEAEFYIGEYFLLRGRKEEAGKLFKAAAERCPADFIEYSGARIELERLGQ